MPCDSRGPKTVGEKVLSARMINIGNAMNLFILDGFIWSKGRKIKTRLQFVPLKPKGPSLPEGKLIVQGKTNQDNKRLRCNKCRHKHFCEPFPPLLASFIPDFLMQHTYHILLGK